MGVERPPEEVEALKKKIIEWLQDQPGGTFSAACKANKVPMSTAYEWRADDKGFNDRVIAARDISDEIGGDLAESKLLKAINNEDLTAIIFYLKTKHKKRGYVERSSQEIDLKGRVTYAEMTDEELDAEIRRAAAEAEISILDAGEG